MASTTIEYKGIEFNIEFEYIEFEKQTLEHPGVDEGAGEIIAVEHQGTCFLEFLDEEDLNNIRVLIFENKL